MKKTLYYIAAAVLTLGLASCAKEAMTPEHPVPSELDGQMTIVARIADGESTKTSLSGDDQSGYDILWKEGDQIQLYYKNGDEPVHLIYTLIEGAGTRSGVFTGPSIPKNIEYTAYAGYGKNLKIALNSSIKEEQSYSTGADASFSPMMAKTTIADGTVTLSDFKNIGGLLRLDLRGCGIVKKIKLTTDQYISGYFTLDEDGAAVMDNVSLFDINVKHTTLNCGESGVKLSAEAKPFYISLPKGSYTGVKIEITEADGQKITKTLKAGKTLDITRSQITAVSMAVIPPGALPKEFSVGANKKVYFSKGNMYFNGSTFRFEEHQYDFTPYATDADLHPWVPNHICQFYWSKSASVACAQKYNESQISRSDVIFTNETETIANSNFTVNGVTGKYRTLSTDEWQYLFNQYGSYGKTVRSGKFSSNVVVCGMCRSIVLLPDNWDTSVISLEDFANTKEYSETTPVKWSEMEAAGAVCLPAAGLRAHTGVFKITFEGAYWSSTLSSNFTDMARYVNFAWDLQSNDSHYRHNGSCLRLVVDID